MLLTADAAATQTLECLKNIYSLLHEIKSQQERTLHNVSNIMKTLDKVTPDDKGFPYYQPRLKNLKNTAAAATTDIQQVQEILRKAVDKINVVRTIRNNRHIQAPGTVNEETIMLIEKDLCNAAAIDTQQVEEIMRNVLDKINEVNEEAIRLIRHNALMKMLKSTAETLPLYVGEAPGVKLPALCGAIPAESTYIAETGNVVAALVEDERPGAENWLLAEVVNFNPMANEYEVVNMEGEQDEHHTLSRSRVVPLPLMRADPETDPHALFPKGSRVMALYPEITLFYNAIVHRPPTTAAEEYLIRFENWTSSKTGYSSPMKVAQRYVISVKRSEKKSSKRAKRNKSRC